MFPFLPFENLSIRHRGVTEPLANAYAEAARVCLNRHHKTPKRFFVNNKTASNKVVAIWHPPNNQTRLAWRNETDTTEQGAYAFALAAVEIFERLYAFSRAETLTGADYYVAPYGKTTDDLEDATRLEVSGVDIGGKAVIGASCKTPKLNLF
ncbi:MAG: hypothetical protein HQL05_12500 [Nitrospirae bacterium]|uniref:hypothetical protein n=1 Tax=Candidatus Magnetobacterium casense TaxID=1455061 RepID=UPI000699246E|nr:hypothetical protein [Candidatus Magnetobacterium casensis]MBF0338636.1 hypothetical protein [Nitrospirota bacterium]